jgi:hypothetical protein
MNQNFNLSELLSIKLRNISFKIGKVIKTEKEKEIEIERR